MNNITLDPKDGYFFSSSKIKALKNKLKVKKIIPTNKLEIITDPPENQKANKEAQFQEEIMFASNIEEDENSIVRAKRNKPLRICDKAEFDKFYDMKFTDLLPIPYR